MRNAQVRPWVANDVQSLLRRVCDGQTALDLREVEIRVDHCFQLVCCLDKLLALLTCVQTHGVRAQLLQFFKLLLSRYLISMNIEDVYLLHSVMRVDQSIFRILFSTKLCGIEIQVFRCTNQGVEVGVP